MKPLVLYAVTIVSAFACTGISEAAPIVIGDPPDDQNCLPFGCEFRTSSRYQQVYSSAAFPGPIQISEIEFYQSTTGDLNIGSFEFYLSTTSSPVNGLDTHFDSNLGADNSLFAIVFFTGAHSFGPSVLSISGTPFLYNPALGNLLLDIIIPGGATRPAPDGFPPAFHDSAFFFASTSGVFSRAHNFGEQFENLGLVTGFNTVIPEPLSLNLLGAGLAGTIAHVRRAKTAIADRCCFLRRKSMNLRIDRPVLLRVRCPRSAEGLRERIVTALVAHFDVVSVHEFEDQDGMSVQVSLGEHVWPSSDQAYSEFGFEDVVAPLDVAWRGLCAKHAD